MEQLIGNACNQVLLGYLPNLWSNSKQLLSALTQIAFIQTNAQVYTDKSYNFICTYPLGEGFGFNGNILETNVLNLGVVLAIVFLVGGDSLTSTLNERKQSIAKNLERAEQRAQEAKDKLLQAKSQLEAAQKRATEILEQGKISAENEKKDSTRKKEEEISRLTKKKEEILYVEQEKAFFQVYEKFVDRIIEKTRERLLTRLNSQTHASVINSQINLISNCKQQ